MKKTKTTPAAPLYTVLGSVNKESVLKIRVIPLTRAKQKGSLWVYPAGDGNKSIPVADLNKIDACDDKSIYSYRGYCFKSRINSLVALMKTIHAGEAIVKVAAKPVAPVAKIKTIVPAVKKASIPPVVSQVMAVSASGKKISKIDQDDIDAVAAVLSGQKERYAVIYKRYYPIILQKFSSSLKFNKELAEDLAADLFTKVFQNLSGYKPKYTFNSWISRVAKNHLVDYVRKQKLDTVSLYAGVSSEKMRNEDSNSAVMEVKDDGVLNPEETILSQERNECIKNAVANLDDNCREVIKKLFYEDKSYVEIAHEMNIPLGTLKSIVFRAKSKLKSMLQADKRALAVVMN